MPTTTEWSITSPQRRCHGAPVTAPPPDAAPLGTGTGRKGR
ncbi:hypothetical protein ACSMX9_20885 [Streptomyces sp. LE64]